MKPKTNFLSVDDWPMPCPDYVQFGSLNSDNYLGELGLVKIGRDKDLPASRLNT